jgi:hypothetical protein
MAESAPTPSEGSSESRGYRRSWKNLLINKRYQLRFTLFMVGLSGALMMLLGIWVKRVADNTTEVGLARVRGEPCPPVPEAVPSRGADATRSAPAAAPGGEAPAVDSAEPADPAVPTEVVGDPSGSAAGEEDRPRGRVLIDESSMTITPTPDAPPVDLTRLRSAFRECEQKQAGLIEDLQQRRRNIGWVLLGSGLLLCMGLAVYGIKMTHRVAGPLHKVGLYFGKMREGHYGPVYPLRKGDELMEFYEHFKAAHAGVVTAERADITRMRAVVEASGSGPHDPQLAKALKDLQVAIERKEKALE